MTQSPPPQEEDAPSRAASLLGQGVADLVRSLINLPALAETRGEVAAVRAAVEVLAERVDRQMSEDRDQRDLLGKQLSALAGSLERLVSHLQGLSTLMAELLERLAAPEGRRAPAAESAEPQVEPEPMFLPGGEGVTVAFAGVPGFQGLMDIQKSLAALESVVGASVERYQEGDSRILLHLQSGVSAAQLLEAVRAGTGLNAVVEESRPETNRLKVRIIAPA